MFTLTWREVVIRVRQVISRLCFPMLHGCLLLFYKAASSLTTGCVHSPLLHQYTQSPITPR